jgi:hypothetical protein
MSVNRPLLVGVAAVAAALAIPSGVFTSNHREAPITALDHKADITDIYAFVSYDSQSSAVSFAGSQSAARSSSPKATLILCVDPLLEPANGPTLFPFDPNILYEIKIDNNQDAVEDVTFQFKFDTEYQLPNVFTSVAGFMDGAFRPGTNTLVVPPRITDFDNPGLNQRQTYTVTMVRGGSETALRSDDGSPFFAVPGNAGPRTMDYEALFNRGTYQLRSGASVVAVSTDDAFWIDLGATFDTANFRTLGSGVPGVLTAAEDAAAQNFAADFVSGYAVNTLAIEVPVEWLTRTGRVEPATRASRRSASGAPHPVVS